MKKVVLSWFLVMSAAVSLNAQIVPIVATTITGQPEILLEYVPIQKYDFTVSHTEYLPNGGSITSFTRYKSPSVGQQVAEGAAVVGVVAGGMFAFNQIVKHSDVLSLGDGSPVHNCILAKYKERKAAHEKVHGRATFHQLEDECRAELAAAQQRADAN